MGTETQNLDNISDAQLEELIIKYGLERVDPDDLPESVVPLKVTSEEQLQSLMSKETNIKITPSIITNNALNPKIGDGGVTTNSHSEPPDGGGGVDIDAIIKAPESFNVQNAGTRTPRIALTHNVVIGGVTVLKVVTYANLNFSTNTIISSGIYQTGFTAMFELKNIHAPGIINNGKAQIWGECDYDAYMIIKSSLFKFGSGHISVYMNYKLYHTGLLDYSYTDEI